MEMMDSMRFIIIVAVEDEGALEASVVASEVAEVSVVVRASVVAGVVEETVTVAAVVEMANLGVRVDVVVVVALGAPVVMPHEQHLV